MSNTSGQSHQKAGEDGRVNDIESGPIHRRVEEDPKADPEEDLEDETEFDLSICIFCNSKCADIEASVLHMRKAHGLILPTEESLAVDFETFLAYLHLVVFGYYECLYCNRQKDTLEALRQHMLAKGHCKIDLLRDDSEYNDFLLKGDEAAASENEEQLEDSEPLEHEANPSMRISKPPVSLSDATSAHLPSGKVILPRGSTQKRLPQRTQTDVAQAVPSPDRNTPDDPPQRMRTCEPSALTKSEKRNIAFANRQLARLSANDRVSLMHLPTSQQRAILAVNARQAARARRKETAMRGRVEGLGNRTLMKHFVIDVPGRKNG